MDVREVGGRQEPAPRERAVKLGVGFLAYNEEELIAKTVEEAVTSLSAIPGLTWHVVVVNDGSRDRTGEIAEELARKDERVSVVHHDGNKGYAVATETALRNVPGEVVMVVDGDGQHTMGDAPRLPGGDRRRRRRRLLLEEGALRRRWAARSSRSGCASCRTGSSARRSTTSTRAAARSGATSPRASRSSTASTSSATRSTRAAASPGGRSPRSIVRHFPREAGSRSTGRSRCSARSRG
jgi:hypothetical protein